MSLVQKLMLVLMLLAVWQPARSGADTAEQMLRRGNAAYDRGDYAEALSCYEKAAADGMAEAQYLLAYSYYMGEGVERNYTSAAQWYKRASAQKHVKAEYNLAYCYMNGRGVPRDYDRALELLTASAEGGYVQAMVTLAECYEKGVLVAEDSSMSEMWKKRSRGENAPRPKEEKDDDMDQDDKAPEVKILYPVDDDVFHSSTMEVKYQLQAGALSRETRVDVFVDGERQPTTRAVRKANIVEVALPRRDCTVTLRASNRNGMSKDEIRLVYDQAAAMDAKRLFAVVVGVSDYDDEMLPDLSYATKDADDFAHVLTTKKGYPYGDVQVKTLIGSDATREEILEAMTWMKQEATDNDVCMFYFAGHGYCDEDGNFYFMADGSTTDNFYSKGVSSDDLMKRVRRIQTNVVVFADACYSGAMLRAQSLVGRMHNLVLYASSSPDNRSMEDPAWGNGAFTKALLGAFKNQAKRKGDHGLSTQWLDMYITDEVSRTTGGRQTPRCVMSIDVNHFNLFEYENK